MRELSGACMCGAVKLRARRRSSGEVEYSVTDTGPGVPDADRERVVQRFVRLDNSRTEPGSGLGLSLVTAVAEAHGLAVGDVDGAVSLALDVLELTAQQATERGEAPADPWRLETGAHALLARLLRQERPVPSQRLQRPQPVAGRRPRPEVVADVALDHWTRRRPHVDLRIETAGDALDHDHRALQQDQLGPGGHAKALRHLEEMREQARRQPLVRAKFSCLMSSTTTEPR
mgnify:CR=1 FL=1